MRSILSRHVGATLVVLVGLIGNPFVVSAQEVTSRSSAKSDHDEATVLLEKGLALYDRGIHDSAEVLFVRARQLAEGAGASSTAALADLRLGLLRCETGNAEEGLSRLMAALAGFDALNDTAFIATTESNVAQCLKQQGRSPEALGHYRRALDLYTSIPDTTGMAHVLNSLAYLYSDVGDHAAAMEQLSKAMALLGPGGNPEIRWTYTAHARISEANNDLAAALDYADRAIPLHRAANDPNATTNALTNRSIALLKMGRAAEALKDARMARGLATDPGKYAGAIIAEGEALKALERWKEALAAFGEGEKLAYRAAQMGVVGALKMERAHILERMGDHRAANAMLREYMAFRDSCSIGRSTREITRMEMNHAFAQKQLADSLVQVETMLLAELEHQKQLSSERSIRNLAMMGGFMVLFLAAGLWYRMRHIRRTRDVILNTQRQLVDSEKQREAEQVRTRIARDIHDELGSELTKITMLSQAALHQFGQDPALMIGHLERIGALSREIGGSLSDIVWAVDPDHDSVQDLVLHSSASADRILTSAKVKADRHFVHHGPDRTLDPETKRNIHLIMKEALNNAVKYAQADTIQVAMETSASTFLVRVKDNGIGFDHFSQGADGNGIRNMYARSRALGAELDLVTVVGEGCTVEVSGTLP